MQDHRKFLKLYIQYKLRTSSFLYLTQKFREKTYFNEFQNDLNFDALIIKFMFKLLFELHEINIKKHFLCNIWNIFSLLFTI